MNKLYEIYYYKLYNSVISYPKACPLPNSLSKFDTNLFELRGDMVFYGTWGIRVIGETLALKGTELNIFNNVVLKYFRSVIDDLITNEQQMINEYK